jgi:hypothetical protein
MTDRPDFACIGSGGPGVNFSGKLHVQKHKIEFLLPEAFYSPDEHAVT